MWSEEDCKEIWKAGEVVSAGVYIRIDTYSSHRVILMREARLPASCDGQVAWYALAPRPVVMVVVEKAEKKEVVWA
jgi:hypothetical protein